MKIEINFFKKEKSINSVNAISINVKMVYLMNNYIKSISITYRKFIFFKSVYHSVLQTVYKWWDKNTEGRGQFSIFPDI